MAAQTKAGILQAASRAFRRAGFNGVGMAGLMAQLGLSHGAAYRHFPSKERLVAECLAASMEASIRRAGAARSVQAWLTSYFAPARLADAAEGCAFAALAVDVTRAEDDELRSQFAAGLEAFAASLRAGIPGLDRPASLRLIAQAAGALILARASRGEMIAEDIRAACGGSGDGFDV